MSSKRRYAAYLFRWQENEDQTNWRAIAEDAHTGKIRHFTDKNELVYFLWRTLQDGTTNVPVKSAGPNDGIE
jgi:hypothetical protein